MVLAALVSGSADSDIEKVLKETDFIKVLESQQKRQSKRLDDLHHRLESELARVNRHFEEMLDKIHISELEIEKNLKRIETEVFNKVEQDSQKHEAGRGGWKYPFIFLVIVLMGVLGFFTKLYNKATKHSHFL